MLVDVGGIGVGVSVGRARSAVLVSCGVFDGRTNTVGLVSGDGVASASCMLTGVEGAQDDRARTTIPTMIRSKSEFFFLSIILSICTNLNQHFLICCNPYIALYFLVK